jgi:hypothetical protein
MEAVFFGGDWAQRYEEKSEVRVHATFERGAPLSFGKCPPPVRTADLVFTTCVNALQNFCSFKSFFSTFARFFANMKNRENG